MVWIKQEIFLTLQRTQNNHNKTGFQVQVIIRNYTMERKI